MNGGLKIMNAYWSKYKPRIVWGFIGGLFHLFTVVPILVVTGGSGEGQAWVVFFLDFPLVMFLKVIPHGNTFLYGPVSSYIFFFSIFGTFLYAIMGGGIGFFLEKIERQPRNARNQTKQ